MLLLLSKTIDHQICIGTIFCRETNGTLLLAVLLWTRLFLTQNTKITLFKCGCLNMSKRTWICFHFQLVALVIQKMSPGHWHVLLGFLSLVLFIYFCLSELHLSWGKVECVSTPKHMSWLCLSGERESDRKS